MRHFCTYFDSRYLPRGLALYWSLVEHCPEFKLWVLCMDDASESALGKLELAHLQVIPLAELEAAWPELSTVKSDRTTAEYYFTITPVLPLHVFAQHPEVSAITYLDADMYFFDSPEPAFDEIGNRSIGIVAHRFARNQAAYQAHGVFNVGFLYFRQDIHGMECLRWWKDRCIEWCYDRVEDGRFADQAYLNDWPTRFQGVAVIEHLGVNLAPWNLANYRLRYANGRVWVGQYELICFHAHALRHVIGPVFDLGLGQYRIRPSSDLLRHVYAPYLSALQQATLQANALGTAGQLSSVRRSAAGSRRSRALQRLPLVGSRALSMARAAKQVVRGSLGSYVLRTNGGLMAIGPKSSSLGAGSQGDVDPQSPRQSRF